MRLMLSRDNTGLGLLMSRRITCTSSETDETKGPEKPKAGITLMSYITTLGF